MKFSSIFKRLQEIAAATDTTGIGAVTEGLSPAALTCLTVSDHHANMTLATQDGSVFLIDFEGLPAVCTELVRRLNETVGVWGVAPLFNLTQQLLTTVLCNNTVLTQGNETRLALYGVGMPTNMTAQSAEQLQDAMMAQCQFSETASAANEGSALAERIFTVLACILLLFALCYCLEMLRRRDRDQRRALFHIDLPYTRMNDSALPSRSRFSLSEFTAEAPGVTLAKMHPFEIEEPPATAPKNNK